MSVESRIVAIFDLFTKREIDDDLPVQTSDEDLLAWTQDLRQSRQRRTEQLIAAPVDYAR